MENKSVSSPGPKYTRRNNTWTSTKEPDGYWITNIPDTPNCGPYTAKAEAVSDRTGLARFFKREDERNFFTVERRAGKGVDASAGADQRREYRQ